MNDDILRYEDLDFLNLKSSIMNSYIIYGHKKSGKTFFLNNLYDRINENKKYGSKIFIPVFIDGLKICDDSIFEYIFDEMIKNITEDSLLSPNITNDYINEFNFLKKNGIKSINEFIETFSIIRKMLSNLFDLNLVIIYDNIDYTIIANDSIQALLKLRVLAVNQKISEHVFIIVSGGVKLYDYHSKGGSPLSNISENIILKPYNSKSILAYFKSKKIKNIEKELRLLNEKFGNHPLIINEIIEKINSKRVDKDLFYKEEFDQKIKVLFKDLTENDLKIFEIFCLKQKIKISFLNNNFKFGMINILKGLSHLKISNLIYESEDMPPNYYLNGEYFAEWFLKNGLASIPNQLSTGHIEMDNYFKKNIINFDILDFDYPTIIDIIELLNYFGNRYVIHSRRPNFLLNSALKYLKEAQSQKREGKIKKIQLEVKFFQEFFIQDMEKDIRLAAFIDKEPEIHGGNEDIIFRKRGIKIPIELKCIWKNDEKRDISKIIRDEYLTEVIQHSQNAGVGFLIILDIRDDLKLGGIKGNVGYVRDDKSGCLTFYFIFQKYKKPSDVK